MSVIHLPQKRRYVSVSNELARDNTLSFEARGVMLYLLSNAEGWEIRSEDIERAGDIGPDKRRSIFRELEAAGYLSARRVRDDKGRLAFRIDAYEEPLAEDLRTRELGTGIRSNRSAENPDSGDSEVRLPPTLNKEQKKERPKEELPEEEKPRGGSAPRFDRFSSPTTQPVNPESEDDLDEVTETLREVFGWKVSLSARSDRILKEQAVVLAAAAVKSETIREYAAARRKEIWHAGFADDLMTWMNRKDGGGGRMTPERRAELEREMTELYRRPCGQTA